MPQADTEAGVAGVGLLWSEASGSSCITEASSSQCDMDLINKNVNRMDSDCSIESSVDLDTSLQQHRDNMDLDAIYNLFAISVSITLQ